MIRRLVAFVALLCMGATAFAQSTYPTQYGGRVAGVVPLVCDTNGANCAPSTGETNGTVVQPALSSTFWIYAPPVGGIVNSTAAVTVKAAAGAGIRNYVFSAQCNSDALGAATEVAIRDGAAGTVLYRQKIPTAGWLTPVDLNFDPPLRGSANTLVEIVTLTASVTGGVYCNLQGYTGN